VGVTRRIVFPVIRLLLWAVIAVALVKIAFSGTDLTAQDDPLQPSAQTVQPTIPVSTGTITNTVTVQGSVVADPAVPARATLAGTVTKVLAKNGDAVAVGAALLEITQETPVEPTVTTDPETGAQTVRENRPKIRRETVTAPIAGTLAMTTLKDQVLSVGDTVGTVAPGTLSVTGTLTPDQQYRLVSAPAQAEVTLRGGPAPFTCTGLRVGPPPADTGGDTTGAAVDPVTGQPVTTSGSVTCAVPAGITAFAGLGADLAITNGSAEGALVVPVTAVQGSVQTGTVWVMLPDGTQEERSVGLGLNDGEQVQITEGLAEGDEVLQFIPVGDVVAPQPGQSGGAVFGFGG
jgi:hypothetical protein